MNSRNTCGLATPDEHAEFDPLTPMMPAGVSIVSTQTVTASGEIVCWNQDGAITFGPVLRKTWKGRLLRTESERLKMSEPPFPPEPDYE